MRIRILGSAAGGGVPQWNCRCCNCEAARAGSGGVRPRTQSSVAGRLLDSWSRAQLAFVKVMPRDYRAALEKHRDHPVSAGGHGLFTRESEEAA